MSPLDWLGFLLLVAIVWLFAVAAVIAVMFSVAALYLKWRARI